MFNKLNNKVHIGDEKRRDIFENVNSSLQKKNYHYVFPTVISGPNWKFYLEISDDPYEFVVHLEYRIWTKAVVSHSYDGKF